MKTLFLLPFILFLNQALAKSLTLSLGESQKLSLKGQSSIWIQDREILKAEGQGSHVLVRGSREGKTTLKIGSETYQVHILHPNKTDAVSDLNNELKRIVGLNSKVNDGDLQIHGHLYRMQDWIRIADFAEQRSFSYQMRAALSVNLQTTAQNHFQSLLEKAKLPPQTIIFEPAPEIRVNGSEMEFRKYQKILSPYGIAVLKDTNSLEIAPTIKVQITVAEIKRDLTYKYGIRWPSSYSAKILSSGGREYDDLPFNLTALEQQGMGKILASPNIICRSGKEAEFLAGGEFPIKIMNYKAQDVLWKRYGILLRVKPKADSSGRISLSIETEVTTLDDSRTVDGIPGLLTNRVSSHFDLTRPQTIALSGLLKSEDGKSSEGLPFLSRIPVLGALFSSKDFRENRSELVIFVRPTLLKEGDDGEGVQHLKGDTSL